MRKVLRKCLNCFRYRPRLMNNIMGNLPATRLSAVRPFLNSGVDYAGPISIKLSHGRKPKLSKAYIALFICFATKAIHIELVGDLTTESFLGALKRFISRRGHVLNLYSDNGTNFVGASRELGKFIQTKTFRDTVSDSLSNQKITWHFIPPRSPHFGGLWESGIKSVKSHIKKVLGLSILTYEEMYTFLTRVEACLNSRPLTPLSDDPNDLSVLTPGHFLIGAPLTGMEEPSYMDVTLNRLSRWQVIDKLHQGFWRRWSREYLPTLQQRIKWKTQSSDICIPGILVLVQEDNLPSQSWKVGRVVETHKGADGIVRVATVRVGNGCIKRSINRLCILPTD